MKSKSKMADDGSGNSATQLNFDIFDKVKHC